MEGTAKYFFKNLGINQFSLSPSLNKDIWPMDKGIMFMTWQKYLLSNNICPCLDTYSVLSAKRSKSVRGSA
jgi:hypothetical protein